MNCYIMSGDIAVAKWQDNTFKILNDVLLPLYLKNTGNVQRWLETRAIDCHRANSRLLKKALRLTEKDDVATVMSVNAVTITDNYWIKPLNSNHEVRYQEANQHRCFDQRVLLHTSQKELPFLRYAYQTQDVRPFLYHLWYKLYHT